jgi:hypothetical protein
MRANRIDSNIKVSSRQEYDEMLNLIAFTADLINGINSLPHKGILWANTFPTWKSGAFGFIASFAGLLKIYRSL